MLSSWELGLSAWELLTAWGEVLTAWESAFSTWELSAWGTVLSVGFMNCFWRGTDCLGISALCLGTTCLRGTALALPAWGLALAGTNQVIFPSFFCNNLRNLFICLSLTLRNQSSLTLSVNCVHLVMVDVDKIDASCDLHNSLCLVLSPRMLLMDLTLA